jgi:hypothetical protein
MLAMVLNVPHEPRSCMMKTQLYVLWVLSFLFATFGLFWNRIDHGAESYTAAFAASGIMGIIVSGVLYQALKRIEQLEQALAARGPEEKKGTP